MDTFKKVIYEDNKQFIEMVYKDLYGKEYLDDFKNEYLKKNYSYFQPSVDDVKSFHKKRIKNALK